MYFHLLLLSVKMLISCKIRSQFFHVLEFFVVFFLCLQLKDPPIICLVCVSGVSADEQYKMKTISVIRGEYVILDPDEDLKDVMMWYFNDNIIAKITGDPNKTCSGVQYEEVRYRGRLMVSQTGSLIITDTRIKDSGVYRLLIINHSNSFSISRAKSFNLSVFGVYHSVIQCSFH